MNKFYTRKQLQLNDHVDKMHSIFIQHSVGKLYILPQLLSVIIILGSLYGHFRNYVSPFLVV